MEQKEVKELKSKLEEASKIIGIKDKTFLDLETSAREKFEKDINGYVHHKKYDNIKEYLKIITNESKLNCLVIESEQGVGKTISVKNMLKDLDKEVLYVNSYTTSLSFYKAVYHNRYKTILLDDVFGLYSDEKGIAILRALTNTEKIRYIKYQSTSDKLDVPSSFVFEGAVIVLTNKITEEMDNSLMSRAIHRKIKFTLKEKIDFSEKVIKFHYELSEKEYKDIMDFVRENVDEATINFSFRSVIKIVEFYNHNKKNWRKMSIEELEKSEELILVKKIFKLPLRQRNAIWLNKTGKSVRTLQRKIKEMGLNDTTTPNIKMEVCPKCDSKGYLEKYRDSSGDWWIGCKKCEEYERFYKRGNCKK